MNIPNTDSWFYLEPYVYTEQKAGKVLLYNTLDASYVEVSDPEIYKLVIDVHNDTNLGVSLIKAELLNKQPYQSFIEEVRQKYIGDVIPTSMYKEKPIQLFPILNLQKEIDRLQKQNENALGQNVLDYLSELTLYINSSCGQSCQYCAQYAKQVKCCSKYLGTDTQNELPSDIVRQLLATYTKGKINVSGGNIFLHSEWNILKAIFESYRHPVFLWIQYQNFPELDQIPSNANLYIFVTFPINEAKLIETVKKASSKNHQLQFLITSEEEYEKAEELAAKIGIKNYNIMPVFNGENEVFFKENVFIDKDDIFMSPLSLKRIFSHQAVNAKFFGNFYILPDQDVKANLNTDTVGNLKETPFIKLIQKELIDNSAWRTIRNHKPCSDCLYQYLCPPPSNYEYAMKRDTMCRL